MISAGELKKPIILKSPVETVNDEGGTVITHPVDTISTFAKVQGFHEGRVSEANYSTMNYGKNFYIRYSTGRELINKDWLLRYEGENYTIHEIERMNEDKRFIRIMAKLNDG